MNNIKKCTNCEVRKPWDNREVYQVTCDHHGSFVVALPYVEEV